ncbi:MAG: FkbM family methyltransferase [Proteobacteria bacterium]|nr:FkbM family methyltransferase [Pseudomonadota bacterium]
MAAGQSGQWIKGGPVSSVEHPWPTRLLRTVQFGVARLRSRDGYVEAVARPFDLRFRGPSADVITRHIYRRGVHEPALTRYLIDRVRIGPQQVALDVGANLGWYSVLLGRLSDPGARVFAFEPDPGSFELLQHNLAANKLAASHLSGNGASAVSAFNVALGETTGTLALHRYKASNNGRHTLLDGGSSGGTVPVPVTTLRAFWEAQQLGERSIRLMKVDVEGFEYFVLRGAGVLLRRCEALVLEYSPDSLPLTGLTPQALPQLLREAGLRPHVFTDAGPVPADFAQIAASPRQLDLLLLR